MKRKYSFYDKEATSPTEVIFDFPQPFYENVDAHLKTVYNGFFIKEINHNSKVIRLHNAYDSGKGMRYVAYKKKEKRIYPIYQIGFHRSRLICQNIRLTI